ncbi:MAG: GFA family protein [Phenylobacterium sp.]|uniref:GFA family protein n=1 Tax=Phenylobacterium sp. TaxID=1871053 RepID=UPI00391C9855
MAFSGGCLCGKVRYTCEGEPLMGGHCHCVDCRKSSGSGHCSHLVVPADSVKIEGAVATYVSPADSGNLVSRAFCPTCGAPVYSTNAAMPGQIFLRASSLDDPEVFTPTMVVYASRAPSWDRIEGGLPTFHEMPPGGPPV